MKQLLHGLFCFAILSFPAQAQVGGSSRTKEAKASSKVPAKAAPTAEPDLVEKLGMPKRFSGAVIDKKSQRPILFFSGSWAPAPVIQGGSSTIAYSKTGAVLQDHLNPGGDGFFRYSFNLGQKNGQILLRVYSWVPEEPSMKDLPPATQEDEGTGSLVDGIYTFELDKVRIMLRGEANGRWEPTSAKLYRWEGTELQSALSPRHPKGDNYEQDRPSQFLPAWSTGSYLVLSDGFLSRAYFRYFGGAATYVVSGVQSRPESLAFGSTFHLAGNRVDPGGWEALAECWDNGLRLEESGSWYTEFQTIFGFGKDWALTGVASASDQDTATRAYTSEFGGTSKTVELAPTAVAEILDRSRDTGWAASAGPFSLRRTLLNAYKGCRLIAPVPAICLTASASAPSKLTAAAELFNKPSLERWKAANIQWAADAETAGAQFEIPKVTGGPMGARLGLLGRVLPNSQ